MQVSRFGFRSALRRSQAISAFGVPPSREDQRRMTPAPRGLILAHPLSVSAGARTPTIEEAKAMPREYRDMSNSIVVPLAMRGDLGACKERLIREIMAVDEVPYEEADAKVGEMSRAHKANQGFWKAPYLVGIAVATTAGFASFPLVFDLNTSLWFNEYFVTADVAEPQDLETPLEVGSWTWNWMEPPLGQISFFLLCLQWARDQLLNIHIQPYTDTIVNYRAKSLASAFPQYDSLVVRDFALADMWD